MDEEHELSYKQFDPSPRYHARDSAVILARIHKAKVLLGSATLRWKAHLTKDLENMAGFNFKKGMVMWNYLRSLP